MIHQSECASLRPARRMPRAARSIPVDATRLSVAESPRPSVVDDCMTNLAADVFDRLFGLLKRQLRGMTLEWRDESMGEVDRSHLCQLNARLFECAAALDHIHAALGPDIARMSLIERELRLTRAAAD